MGEDRKRNTADIQGSVRTKMNVLFFAGWFPQSGNYKGIFIKEHALAAAKFHDVAVIYGREKIWQKERFRHSFSMEENLKVLRSSYREIPLIPSYHSYINGVLLSLEKLISEGFHPDIVNACVYKTGTPASIIKKKYGIPYVLTEHCSGFARKSLRKSHVKKAQKGMKEAEFILPVSNSLKEDIISYGIEGRFEVVPNVASDHFSYSPQTRNKSGVKKVLCVAAMHPKKNIPGIISACRIICNIREDIAVDIVGEGEKMDEYKKTVQAFSLDGVIRFLGGKSKEDIARMMQNADFFVLPSRYEPFGVVFIEALACGLPVVATRVGGIPEIVDDKSGILVEPDNPQALADAMMYMMDNSGGYDREKISLDARRKYSCETVGEKLNAIYEQALKKHNE